MMVVTVWRVPFIHMRQQFPSGVEECQDCLSSIVFQSHERHKPRCYLQSVKISKQQRAEIRWQISYQNAWLAIKETTPELARGSGAYP
jgi:outer membrane phospholipase A